MHRQMTMRRRGKPGQRRIFFHRIAAVITLLLIPTAPALAQTPPVIHMTVPLPPSLVEDAPAPEIVCRPPQPQTDSRLLGPRICKSKKQWDDLHAQGLDISADGKSVVASEKYRSLNPQACGSASCN